MSTANKLTYLNQTKQELKQAINNIGGSIDDNTTFRQYANQLQNVYDNLPKTEYQEGTKITLSNTLKGKLDFDNGVVGIGQTEQDSTQGYNLIDINSGEIVTVTFGVDRSINGNEITLNGSRNDGETSIGRIIIDNITEFNSLVSGRTYKLTLNDTSGTYTGKIGLAFLGGSPLHQLDFIETNSFSVTKTLNFSDEVTKIWLIFNGNFSATNFKFKLMLQEGTSTYDWEPYTNGASPNPSYPQEIKYVRGKNRLNPNQYINAVVNNTSIGSTGTLVAWATSWVTWVKMEKNQTYVFSGDLSHVNSNVVRTFVTNSEVAIGTSVTRVDNLQNGGTYTNTNGYKYLVLEFLDVSAYEGNWQLEKGSTSTPYLPYNTIEEVVSGKNLADLGTINKTEIGVVTTCTNQRIKYNGTTSASGNLLPGGFSYYSLGTFKKGTYTLSFKFFGGNYTEPSGVGNAFYFRVPSLDIVITTGAGFIVSGWLREIELTEDAEVFIQHYVNGAGMILNNFEYGVQIEQGSTATTYEPYITPTSYQLSLGEYEFNAIGDYKDELIYDVDEDRVYKNEVIRKYKLVGNEVWTISGYSTNEYLCCYTPVTYRVAGNNAVVTDLRSNRFKAGAYTQELGNVIASINNENVVNICISKSIAQDTTALNTYFSNNETYIYYPLKTPTLTEIVDETLHTQVKALYNAHSNNGTTIITSNGNLPMIIKCRGLKAN